MIERQTVQSSHIVSIGHKDGILEVEYNGGQVYQYHGITGDEFKQILSAKSIGSHMRSVIAPRAKQARIR